MTTPVSNNNGNNNFDEILDRCLQAIESGQMTIEQCAARYPNYPELASLLRMAVAFADLPRPQMPGAAPLQRRLQAQFREQYRVSTPRRSPSFPWQRLLVTIGVLLLIIFIGGAGLVSASASALPGDGLTYSVKRGYESVRLSLARENDRPQMLYDLAETRLNEVRALAAQGRTVDEATVDDVYNSVTLALGSVTDTGKRNQLTTDAVNAVQAALTQGVINPVLAQLTTQKLQIVSNVNARPTPTPGLVEATTVTPSAVPSSASSGTPEATQVPSITFTPSFTASSTDTMAPPTLTPSASPTQTATSTPTATVPAPVIGPSATPTLGRGPAVTIPGLPTTPAPATQTPTVQGTAAGTDIPTTVGTDESTEPATQEATATTEVTDTPADTATDTPSFTPTATKTSTPTITPKPPTATPTATVTNSATAVPTPNGLPAQTLKQNPQEITFHDCKSEGSGGDPVQNQNRNRVDDASQYPTTAFDSIAKFPWPKDAEGKPHNQWSQDTSNAIAQAEGLPVMVEVYLVKVQEDGPEVQNCNSTYHTWQLWLLANPGTPNDVAKALVAGVTPRIAVNHAGWTLDKLNALAATGAKVRISGWLMFNEDQAGEVGKSRASLWEIHPVMQIAVAKGNQWVNLDDYQP